MTDNVTGLIWQDDVNTTVKVDQADAAAQCSALGMRLPTIEELQYIVHKGYYKPALSPEFKNVKSDYFYWTSSVAPKATDEYNQPMVWTIYFEAGTDHYKAASDKFYARCVKGTSVSPAFSKNGDIVTDSVNKLQWQDNTEAKIDPKNWVDAIDYCENLSLGNHNDWRLPNINELLSIADKHIPSGQPGINSSFTNVESASDTPDYTNSPLYWSSTTSLDFSDRAYTVNFYFGDEYDYGTNTVKNNVNYVRCVRNGN